MTGVSIIIPAYNYAQYLERAVRSVLAQPYGELEVVIIDDGSTDATPEVGQRLAAECERVRYIRQANAGLSGARNTGIREARFDFVSFLDADDEFLPTMLTTTMAAFSSLPDTTGMVACNCFRVDEHGNPIGEKRVAPRGDRWFSAGDILLKTRFPCCGVVRRSCFADCGDFDVTLRSSEDRDMWVRLAARHGIFYLDAALVRIRRHGSNMSRNAERMLASMRRVREKAFAVRERMGLPAHFWLMARAVEHFQAGWMFWDEGRKGRALWHACMSMVCWPLPLDHRDLHEPPLFRVRALLRFLTHGRPR